jgi:protein tyrosine/serine phosphatase/predicted nucleotidyltransferase
MKENLLKKCVDIFKVNQGVDAAILYGSWARGTANPNSDIDIQVLVNSKFKSEMFIEQIKNSINIKILKVVEIKLRCKIVIYFYNYPKLELAICNDIHDINRNYIGSEIKNYDSSILYHSPLFKTDLRKCLKSLTEQSKDINISEKSKLYINKFIYEFENCSDMHRRSDGYRFYFFYNIALDSAVKLFYYSKGYSSFDFLPRYFIPELLNSEERETFYSLYGSMFLPNANEKKRNLLDFFYKSLEQLNLKSEEIFEIKHVCESFYERDYFWNFRDIAKNNPAIKKGFVFRSATLSLFEKTIRFKEMVEKLQIKTIIDIRADRELEETSYSEEIKNEINYVRAPFDPWNQPEWYKKEFNYGTNEEIAYRFFIMGCKNEIKTIFESILNEKNGAVVIHCFAGKDRTGIFISLIHLLSGADYEIIKNDFMASEVDMKLHRLNLVLDIVEKEGGIENYLLSCGISKQRILEIKKKLFYEK